MPEPLPTEVGKPTARSGAIYRSAEAVCALIETETAHALKPLQKELVSTIALLKVAQEKNDRLIQNTGFLIAQAAAKPLRELKALKAVLEGNGIGFESISGQHTLRFVGDLATVVSEIDEQVKRFIPDSYHAITPSSIVEVLVQCLRECATRLEDAYAKYTNAMVECDRLKTASTKRDEEVEAETSRWKTERDLLENSLTEAQAEIVQLEASLASFRANSQAVVLRFVTAQTESDEWKAKYEDAMMEWDRLKTASAQRNGEVEAESGRNKTERDHLETSLTEAQTEIVNLKASLASLQASAQTESSTWKAQYEALKTERDSLKIMTGTSVAKLATVQADLDLWKGKCLTAEAAKKESDGKSKQLEMKVDKWKTKYRAAQANVKTATDEGGDALTAAMAEVDRWKKRSLATDSERDSVQSDLRDADAKLTAELETSRATNAQWEAKAASWDAERKRHKTQAARNIALVTQLQQEVLRLETRIRAVEEERDRLLPTDNTQATENKDLMAEGEDLLKTEVCGQKKKSPVISSTAPTSISSSKKRSTSSSKAPPSLFIKPLPSLRSIPDKPPFMGPLPTSLLFSASTNATPMSQAPRRYSNPTPTASTSKAPADQSSLAPPRPSVMGFQAGVQVRRGAAKSPATSTTGPRPSGSKSLLHKSAGGQPRAPPPLAADSTGPPAHVVGEARPLVRATPRNKPALAQGPPTPATPPVAAASSSLESNPPRTWTPRADPMPTSKRPTAESASPVVSKRPALSSQSNSSLSATPKSAAEPSLKRSAQSPLLSERTKTPRTSAASATSTTPASRSSFTKPPTPIATPTNPSRVPAPIIAGSGPTLAPNTSMSSLGAS
ncbi:hypothetical protein C8R43DRAFT_87506 [Mycena crocata]|nr:hypothetical protein C8R43DRAFT_87506 [Mycena crocata]